MPVYLNLRSAIIEHRVQPGTKLPEDELSAIYSVSRGLVRPALQALAHEHLVRLEPNKGAFVAQPSRREARDVFAARTLVEPGVAALAAIASTPAGVKRLRDHLVEEHAALHDGDHTAAITLSARFHCAIAKMAGNEILADFVEDLLSRSSLVVALYWKRRETTCASDAHEDLVSAIERHDPDMASRLMHEHITDLLAELDLSSGTAKQINLAEVLGRSG